MTHRLSIIAPRAINRWAVWAVSLKVENRLDFQLPKLPINKSVDNLWPVDRWCLVRAPPASEWTASTIAQTAHWKGRAEFRSAFCFAPDGWLEGGRQGRAVRDCDWHGPQTIFCKPILRNKIF
jgi:hypothetical protein